MPGKIAEDLKIENLQSAERLSIATAATLYYNGLSITNSAIMIDTQGYDEALIVLDVGTVLGAVATINNYIYESDTNDFTAATLLTGASFTPLKTTNDEATYEGAVLTKGTKRYLGLVTELLGAPATIDMSAKMILGKADSAPVSKTLHFDL